MISLWMDAWINEWIDRWMNGRMSTWIDGWMHVCMNGWMVEKRNKQLPLSVILHIFQDHKLPLTEHYVLMSVFSPISDPTDQSPF